jgi:hypothetical protein
MALVVVGALKGRPGVTTSALGLAAVCDPSARPVLVECDPGGGDLAARHGLAVVPGVVELAAAVHRRSDQPAVHVGQVPEAHRPESRVPEGQVPEGQVDVLSRCAQRLRVGGRTVEVVLAPPGAAQAALAVQVLAGPGVPVLAGSDRLVVADCGRLDRSSPAWPLLPVAAVTVLLVRGEVADVAHAQHGLGEIARAAGARLVMVAAGGRYGPAEVDAALATVWPAGVGGVVPDDPRGAGVLVGDLRSGSHWRRSGLARALQGLLHGLPVRAGPNPDAAGPDTTLAPFPVTPRRAPRVPAGGGWR